MRSWSLFCLQPRNVPSKRPAAPCSKPRRDLAAFVADRLTVVTIFGLIGTIATGFLGMNLLAEADEPLLSRIVFFIVVSLLTITVTGIMIVKSKRQADFIDALSNERISWRGKWQVLRKIW